MKKFYFEMDPRCPAWEGKIEEAYEKAKVWGIGENTITLDKEGKGTIECLRDPHEVADRVYFTDDNGEVYFGIVGDLISDDDPEEEKEAKILPSLKTKRDRTPRPIRNKEFSLEDVEEMSEEEQENLFDQYDRISKKYGV